MLSFSPYHVGLNHSKEVAVDWHLWFPSTFSFHSFTEGHKAGFHFLQEQFSSISSLAWPSS